MSLETETEILETPVSRSRLIPRLFLYQSQFRTQTETVNFETEIETQMEVVETKKDKTREICSRLKFSKLTRPILFDNGRDWSP